MYMEEKTITEKLKDCCQKHRGLIDKLLITTLDYAKEMISAKSDQDNNRCFPIVRVEVDEDDDEIDLEKE